MSDSQSLAAEIVAFCRFVRSNGVGAGSGQTLDALRAAEAIGIADRSFLMMALRSILCSSREEWDSFAELFDQFWNQRRRVRGEHSRPERESSVDAKAVASFGSGVQHEATEEGAKEIFGAGQHERLGKIEFSEIAQSDLAALERLATKLLRQMAIRLARRLKRKIHSRGPIDIRRTIRCSIGRGGDPADLRRKGKRREQNRLVLLLDVSGSMNAYSIFLLQFSYALQKHFRRVHTFLFSTRLVDITASLKSRSLRQGLAALSREAIGWSGGTKIGESLRELQNSHGRRVLSRDTIFIVLSDGWDTGEPQVLAAELGAIRARVRRTIWLNPLLGMEGYEPVTRGMSAALPHVDVFAPAHNLESLLQLERHLNTHRFR
jgi:uncharacterized protein